MTEAVERFLNGELPVEADSRLRELHAYWASLKPSTKVLPSRADFDPVAVPTLLPLLWMLDVTRDPLRLRYRLIGTEITRVMGRDYTGWWVDEVPGIVLDTPSYKQIQTVAAEGVIGFQSGWPTFRSDRYYPWRERLLLPMTVGGEGVDIVLAITAYGVAARPG